MSDNLNVNHVHDLVAGHLSSAKNSWSIGAFGAIAEFHRDAAEPTEIVGLTAVTHRGAIVVRSHPDCRAFAYELPSARQDLWLHGVALCLPENATGSERRARITELGPDREALRPEDRDAVLFDLGLGRANCDFCVRTSDPALQERLRNAQDVPFLENAPLLDELKRRSPHRVMQSPLGRIEVFQHIGRPGERSPDGPHTHLLPGLVRQGRTHAANIPIPEGWLPCLSLYPPNPVQDEHGRRKSFDRAEYDAFRLLLERYGDPEYVRTQHEVMDAVRAGARPDPAAFATRMQRVACRIALRQLRQLEVAPERLEGWRQKFDNAPAAPGAGAH